MLSDDTDMPYDGGDDTEDLEEWPTSEPATPSTSRLSFYDDDEDFVAPDEPAPGFATHTAFDAYFLQASKPSRTSSNVRQTLALLGIQPFAIFGTALFVGTLYVSLDTALGFTTAFVSSPPRELNNIALFVLTNIWPGA